MARLLRIILLVTMLFLLEFVSTLAWMRKLGGAGTKASLNLINRVQN